ncbi:MAG: amidohydrolase family protein, partial [Dehalococcoidia bacterium]|nr:amidohydrolase family protein [Dehalococcoidia bacterium]
MPNEQIPTWSRDQNKRGSLTPLRGSAYPLIDAHLHVVNFIQDTPGGEKLMYYMDRANVRKAVIFGLPVTKMWNEWEREHPDYYLADDARCYYYACTDVVVAEMVRSLPAEQQDRLLPLICGFNPTDRYAIRHIERMYAQYPDLWSGIGEVLLRHDDLTSLTYGEPPRANHRAMWPVYQFAGDHDLPVLLHPNVTSVSRSDQPVYLYELEEAVRDHPRTRFVFAHCGMSRRVNVPFYHKMVQRLLEQYPNLYVDYSWIIFDVVICPNGQPSEEWLALTERFSDRICLGSDLVTRFERLGPELQRYDVF